MYIGEFQVLAYLDPYAEVVFSFGYELYSNHSQACLKVWKSGRGRAVRGGAKNLGGRSKDWAKIRTKIGLDDY